MLFVSSAMDVAILQMPAKMWGMARTKRLDEPPSEEQLLVTPVELYVCVYKVLIVHDLAFV